MIPFIDDPRWDTSSVTIRNMQEKQILENKLRKLEELNYAIETGNALYPKTSKECQGINFTNSFQRISCVKCKDEGFC